LLEPVEAAFDGVAVAVELGVEGADVVVDDDGGQGDAAEVGQS